MHKKYFTILLTVVLLVGLLAGCGAKKPAASGEDVTITVAGSWTDCRALDEAASAFTAEYPNCTVVYEYLQDYYPSLEKRMTGDDSVDLFFTTNIQEGSDMLPYALDLNSCEGLDLSGAFDGLIENFTFREADGNNTKLYAIPLGAEMRGLYVNTTLLDSLGIKVPTDQDTLLAACRILKDAGYIPFHGNPGDFSQTLLYPWICNIIANSDDPEASYRQVDSRDPGVSELFREPFEFLYTLVENGYYDYKTAQTKLDLFNETTDEDYARYFFNIKAEDDGYVKADDVGQVAFLPSPMSLQSVFSKTRDDYHSNINYVFIPAPVSKNGGYAYLSPAHGIAANKDSANLEWSIKFLNFLFQPENNTAFCQAFNVIPNTADALSYITDTYSLPAQNICELGQVTFSYDFYGVITATLLDESKANNPKYMQTDANGNQTLYPVNHYIDALEAAFQEK